MASRFCSSKQVLLAILGVSSLSPIHAFHALPCTNIASLRGNPLVRPCALSPVESRNRILQPCNVKMAGSQSPARKLSGFRSKAKRFVLAFATMISTSYFSPRVTYAATPAQQVQQQEAKSTDSDITVNRPVLPSWLAHSPHAAPLPCSSP